MFDYRGYLVILSSVFLALAIGLLVGISFGEDFLIYNQQEVIDKMEQKIGSQEDQIGALRKDLAAWESFREYFRLNFSGDSSPAEERPAVDIISNSVSFTREVASLMDEEGIKYRTISLHPQFISRLEGSSGQVGENLAEAIPPEIGLLTSLIFPPRYGEEDDTVMMGELMQTGEIELQGNWSEGESGSVALLLYDCLVAEGDDQSTSEAAYRDEGLNYFFQELAASLQAEGYRVVVAFSGFDAKEEEGRSKDNKTGSGGGLPAGCRGWGEAIVDHTDTFWGQIALLDVIIKGAEGHYGFQSGSSGIFPTKAKDKAKE